jgi:hypothetical protein
MRRDYRLYELNEDEFEGLVVRICVRWLGEGVMSLHSLTLIFHATPMIGGLNFKRMRLCSASTTAAKTAVCLRWLSSNQAAEQ